MADYVQPLETIILYTCICPLSPLEQLVKNVGGGGGLYAGSDILLRVYSPADVPPTYKPARELCTPDVPSMCLPCFSGL